MRGLKKLHPMTQTDRHTDTQTDMATRPRGAKLVKSKISTHTDTDRDCYFETESAQCSGPMQ